jgi:hypothetical protein
MTAIVDWAKDRWHRDLVSDPVVHGWALNLYRAGERYPQTVADYFPAEAAPSAALAESIRAHRRDEERHTAMYAHAIHSLGQPVVELDGDDVFNVVIRKHTRAGFTVAPGDSAEVRRLKVAHFLVHAHTLERRVARSLEYHLDACARAGSPVARIVDAVLRDEREHVRYTAEAGRGLLTRAEAERVFEHHARAEAVANLTFSARQVRAFARRFEDRSPARRRRFYRFCGAVMEAASGFR